MNDRYSRRGEAASHLHVHRTQYTCLCFAASSVLLSLSLSLSRSLSLVLSPPLSMSLFLSLFLFDVPRRRLIH